MAVERLVALSLLGNGFVRRGVSVQTDIRCWPWREPGRGSSKMSESYSQGRGDMTLGRGTPLGQSFTNTIDS